MTLPLSILDLAEVSHGETPRDALAFSVTLAQSAEHCGYHRVWYAEHHNIPAIASAATAVVIAHIAAHTETIRVGAGGIMLPNHSPLVIAEQFGTLEALHPGRIDLGLGRAPGSDQQTFRAMRREHAAADRFPNDVVELQGYLGDESRVPGVVATPGQGSNVPLYILGSSLFGAQLAALLGLPYAFASHFAPRALEQAVAVYRERFQSSAQLEQPYVMAGMNVIATEDPQEAERHFLETQRRRARLIFGRGDKLTAEQVDEILASPAREHVDEMLRCSAVGTPDQVAKEITAFAESIDADELILAGAAPDKHAKLRTFELLAQARDMTPAH